jgi:hypothetical protein
VPRGIQVIHQFLQTWVHQAAVGSSLVASEWEIKKNKKSSQILKIFEMTLEKKFNSEMKRVITINEEHLHFCLDSPDL